MNAESSAKGGIVVAEVRVGKNESLDRALRRFKQNCRKSGVFADARKHEVYDKPRDRKSVV